MDRFIIILLLLNIKILKDTELKVSNVLYKDDLKNILEVDDNSIKFIAFYNMNDLSNLDKEQINGFDEAVKELKNENSFNIDFYFYDDIVPKEIQDKYHLYKYTFPKIKMNKSGKITTYKGSLKKYSIKNFIKREYRDFKVYHSEVKIFEDLKSYYNTFDETILYIGDKINPIYLKYIDYSKNFKEIKFLYSDNFEMDKDIQNHISSSEKKLIGKKPYLYIFKRSISKLLEIYVIQHKEFDEIKKFLKMIRRVKLYKIPKNMMVNFVKFNEPFLMLVSQNGLFERETEEICYELNVLKCTQFDDSYEEFKEFINYLNHEKNKETLYIIDPNQFVNNFPLKYKMNNIINKENIKEFILNWKNKKIKPYLKSGKVIDNKHNLVYEIVSDNFKESLESSKSDVLLFVYSKDCLKCDDFKIEYFKVAKYFEKYYPRIPLKFMMINFSENEIPNLKINYFPSFFMYSRKNYISPNRAYFDLNFESLMSYLKKKTPFLNEPENNIEL